MADAPWVRWLRWLRSAPSLVGGAEGLILNGMLAVALGYVVWKWTGSFLGWAALTGPGGALIIIGCVAVFRGKGGA